MNKTTKIVIGVVAALAVIAAIVAVIAMNSKPKTNLDPITSAEDLTALVDKVYEGLEIELPRLMSQTIDLTDEFMFNRTTGLDNSDNFEYVVASEPMMSSQAYSLVLAKVKDGVNANEVAKKMNENVNESKWVCVTADKIYTTTSGDVICLVMSAEETAKPVYENFKKLAGTVGEEYERSAEVPEFPDEMLDPGTDVPADDAETPVDGDGTTVEVQ